MSTTTRPDPDVTATIRRPDGIEPASIPGVPFTRLLRAEWRKMTNTRSGFWLVLVMVLGALAAMATVVATWDRMVPGPGSPWTLGGVIIPFVPMTLLPVLAILLITSEWSTRSALSTFALEPRRGRVIAAKAAVTVATTVAIWVLCQGLTALAALLGETIHTTSPVSWTMHWSALAGDLAQTVLLVAVAAALGLAIGNAPAAIVGYMVLPLLTTTLGMIPGLRTAMSWISLDGISTSLLAGTLGSRDWAHVIVSALIWIVVPAVIGTVLTLRREVK